MAAVLVLVLVIAAPIAYLVWRLRHEEATPGGSQGRQIFGHEDDDWGPKS